MSLTGLVLLFGIGTKALPSWDSEDEAEQSYGPALPQSNGSSKQKYELNLIHRPARDIIPPLGGARVFLLSRLILHGPYAA